MAVSACRVCGLVAYDGTDFKGFQVQDNVPTIQGALENALQSFAERTSRVVGSGRTDTGVHARGQVIAVEVVWHHGLDALQRAWNHYLPAAIVVRRLAWAAEGFHPRFSAISRTYRYRVICAVGGEPGEMLVRRSPLTDRFALYEPQPLDLATMNAAASTLLGEHDFATFGQPPQGEVTIRHVSQMIWQRVSADLPTLEAHPPQCLVFTVTANAFLRRMVRNLVGTLLEVGRGDRSVDDVSRALAAQERRFSSPPAPAQGLVLEKVNYPAHVNPFS